jgi:metallophosphoesterase (TIGR00282 family)
MKTFKILFLGDIVGPLGRKGVKKYLSYHKEKDQIDFVIANGENTTHGHGLSYEHYLELLSYGVDVLTSGNHYFGNPDHLKKDKEMDKQIRPYNLDTSAPGVGTRAFEKDGITIRVSNILGKTYLTMTQQNPFLSLDELVAINQEDIHIVDIHAEATAEKRCLAEYVAGKVSACIGTHTHVQTNDAKLLKGDTFFLTDVGMNGAYYSSIGADLESCIQRTKTGIPGKSDVPRKGKILVNGVLLEFDRESKKVLSYQLINETMEDDPE